MARIDDLERRLDAVSAENQRLAALVDDGAATDVSPDGASIDRRSAMRSLATAAFGGAALFGATAVGRPTAAEATEHFVVLGGGNVAESATSIDTNTSYALGLGAETLDAAFPNPALYAVTAHEGNEAIPQLELASDGGPPGRPGYAGSILATAPNEDYDSQLYYYHQGIESNATIVGRVHTSTFSNFTAVQAASKVMSTFRGGPYPAGTRDAKGRLDSGVGGSTYKLDLSGDVEPDCIGIMASVTTYDADTPYYLWMWGAGSRPSAAALRYEESIGQTQVLVPLAPDLSIQLWTKAGRPVHVQIDIVGQVRTGQGEGGVFAAAAE